jgi:pantoate--beta-alanine ligase
MSDPLPIARTVAGLRQAVARYRAAGESVALVPTMGALHAGHLSLVRYARQHARRVVASIFVNPKQFGPNEDLSTYPRTFEADVAAFAQAGVDLVWAPSSVGEMYPPGFSVQVVPGGPALAGLEDAVRPHFFAGVATVVTKLLLQVLPDTAVFGEKDFQQLRVIQRMVEDLNISVTILGAPTEREPDGLALSSRNRFLSGEERAQAPRLFAALSACAKAIAAGRELAEATAEGRASLARHGFAVDYFEARQSRTLAPLVGHDDGPIRLLAAARLGSTRLIDNIAVPLT